MSELENLTDLSAQGKERLTSIVVIDHPEGTDVYGTDAAGEAITTRVNFFGNFPWTASLGAIVERASWNIGEGVEDREPETGFPRYTFSAIVH